MDNMGKVLVNADALEKIADFISTNYLGDCEWCPAWDICDGYEDCGEAIKAYLIRGIKDDYRKRS